MKELKYKIARKLRFKMGTNSFKELKVEMWVL